MWVFLTGACKQNHIPRTTERLVNPIQSNPIKLQGSDCNTEVTKQPPSEQSAC